MDWKKVRKYLTDFSTKSSQDADACEAHHGKGNAQYKDQVQRKRIYAELSLMLALALKAGMETTDEGCVPKV